jgi:hypothetical protein
MNPLKAMKIYRRFATVAEFFERATQDWETRRKRPGGSVLYATPSFWVDALTAARDLVLLLPVPSAITRRLTMKNWKTSLGGVATLLAVGAKLLNGGELSSTDLALVTTAIGLLFAKDHNVTGGTAAQ